MQTIFFHFFFPVFFLFVLNITIALLNYFEKNVINNAIASYFLEIISTHLLKIFWQLLTQINGIRQEKGKGSNGLFSLFHSTEVLVLFDDVPTGHHTRTTRSVVPGGRRQAHSCMIRNNLPLP